MATRNEVEQRKNELKQWVRAEYEKQAAVGAILPPVKTLATRHGLSVNVAHQIVRELAAEGTLHTVPGVGTFFGLPPVETSEFYLFLRSEVMVAAEQEAQSGFEGWIARQGGASLALTMAQAQDLQCRERLPTLAGIYGVIGNRVDGWRWSGAEGVAQVCFAGYELGADTDLVSYNDAGGSSLAAEHLLRTGHRRIAFLGLHTPDAVTGPIRWSALREAGWRQTLEAAGVRAEGLAFHPEAALTDSDRLFHAPQAAREAARSLAFRDDVTAVVAANDNAALGLFAALQHAGRPRETWPAVVGFDNQETPGGYWLTSLHLPAADLGRAAAELLWNRRRGLLTGAPLHRQTAMRLLPRLSSQTGWAARLSETAFV